MLYPYRCTEQQLPDSLRHIEESGDTIEHVVYKGGRDYVLICRAAESEDEQRGSERGQS